MKKFTIKNAKEVMMALLFVVTIFCVSSFFWSFSFGRQKIAYIKSAALVYGYAGMQEAHNKFSLKEDVWKANIDTLKNEYQNALNEFKEDLPKLAASEKEEREKQLYKQKQSFENYKAAIDKKVEDEDTKETQAVLGQINSFVADYGKEHGYDLIIGTTNDGNLMYAKASLDITDEVLKALNDNYKGIASK